MANFIISEETIHYAIQFLERWQEKAPTSRKHLEASQELRNLSDYLIEHINLPTSVGIVRYKKK